MRRVSVVVPVFCLLLLALLTVGKASDGPPAITQQGDTTWVQIHTDGSSCPGDPAGGHGGEGTGGPDGSETWCFEGAGGDSCGTLPPWDVTCFLHRDMRIQPSDLGINYWHVDTYRADQQAYCGNYALWCGSDSAWGGDPVECGTWDSPPGYGNSWHCIAQLTLPCTFSYADGCTVQFDTRYDTECNLDFMFLEYNDGEAWRSLAEFTATSDNFGTSCNSTAEPPYDHFSNRDTHSGCDWQGRGVIGVPAFSEFLPAEDLSTLTGLTWTLLEPPDESPWRFCHDMAYDSGRGRCVIFGGIDRWGNHASDTYEWDDSTWVDMTPASNPGGRRGHQLVYFPDSSFTVLFGGDDGTDYLDDTWVWDSTDWRQVYPLHSPPARYGHGMAYDSARGVIVLFGGRDSSGYLGDTWEWNGVDWVERFPVDSPIARYFLGANGIAYDAARGVSVLFAGLSAGGQMNDTWEWDGVNWSQVASVLPYRRYAHGIAYDPTLGGTVIHAGYSVGSYRDNTWLWDGTSWSELHPGGTVLDRGCFAMIFDGSAGRIITHGGTPNGSDPIPHTFGLDHGDPLRLRWRFFSDAQASDADYLDTDGGAWIDNIQVVGTYETFTEDFESGTADPGRWSFPDHEGFVDGWHMVHDYDPPYEGGDSGHPLDCVFDSSVVYQARPEGGFAAGTPARYGWSYALMTPAIAIENTGCVAQYDRYMCASPITCDFINTRVRFYDIALGIWCPWIDTDGVNLWGGCWTWTLDLVEDLTPFYGASEDSVQFAWVLEDLSRPYDFCRGKHPKTDLQIDNVSVGFFDGHATQFATRPVDLLLDTFHTGICGYNSHFDEYSPDTVTYYSGGTALPWANQFVVDVIERDGVGTVHLSGSIDAGNNWTDKAMNLAEVYDPGNPDWGGTYYGTFCPADFGLAGWDEGTDLWYCVRVTDDLAEVEYFPQEADPLHPGHTGLADDYFDYSVLPMYPPGYTEPKVLLVDAYGDDVYDVSPCVTSEATRALLADLYGQILADAGYTHDVYQIRGAGGSVYTHPTDYSDYDTVIWFTGPGYDVFEPLIDGPAQRAIRDYLAAAGKVIICGDRMAANVADVGEGGYGCDSLGGEFLEGVLGTDYITLMAAPLDKPYIYCAPESTVNVFGVPTPVNLDSLDIYRGCPQFRYMDWVQANPAPPVGYTAQPLLTVINADVPDAQMAVYVEYMDVGQCVFFNFDLMGADYCDGGALLERGPGGAWLGEGRPELLQFVMEDLYDLPPSEAGVRGRPRDPGAPDIRWALYQNAPNPCRGATQVRYDVAVQADVSIRVYSTTGRLVKTLVDRRTDPGRHAVTWDGRNSSGQRVADGIYFYKMEAGPFKATKKVLLVR